MYLRVTLQGLAPRCSILKRIKLICLTEYQLNESRKCEPKNNPAFLMLKLLISLLVGNETFQTDSNVHTSMRLLNIVFHVLLQNTEPI